MSLLAASLNGLIGAIFTGILGYLVIKRGDRKRTTKYDAAWQNQAKALDTRLSTRHQAEIERLSTQHQAEIERLDRQYQGQVRGLNKRLDQCQQETQRLQRLIGLMQEQKGSRGE